MHPRPRQTLPPAPAPCRLWVALLATLLLGTASAARAVDPRSAALNCLTCHPPEAGADAAIASLAGREPAWVAARLRAFKSGEAPATLMDRIARGYTDEDIDALAEALSRLQP